MALQALKGHPQPVDFRLVAVRHGGAADEIRGSGNIHHRYAGESPRATLGKHDSPPLLLEASEQLRRENN